MKRLSLIATPATTPAAALALIFVTAFCLAFTSPARAQSEVSAASVGASMLSGIIVTGSPDALANASGRFVVSAIDVAGASGTVVLKGVSDAAEVSVRVPAQMLSEAGVSIGTTVSAVADASGTLLVAGGRVLCYVPNQVGRSLLGSSRTSLR